VWVIWDDFVFSVAAFSGHGFYHDLAVAMPNFDVTANRKYIGRPFVSLF
jgi:hypothetical protein